MYGILEDFRGVRILESGIISTGRDSVVFWRDKIGGEMMGRCDTDACCDTIAKAAAGMDGKLEALERYHLDKVHDIRRKRSELQKIVCATTANTKGAE